MSKDNGLSFKHMEEKEYGINFLFIEGESLSVVFTGVDGEIYDSREITVEDKEKLKKYLE